MLVGMEEPAVAVTIKDVAKLADVAPSTVSRVIANSPRISERTKRIVRAAMEELGYHPNYHARSLANRSTHTIGIIMPSSGNTVFQNPFFPEVIRGISTKAHENDYGLYMSTGANQKEIYEGVVNMVQGGRVDGIVLLYSRIDDELIDYLLDRQFPFTIVGKPYQHEEKIVHVDNDNFRAAQEATDFLIQLGHKKIGFVGGGLDFVVTMDRLLGYERATRLAHLPFDKDYIVHQEFLLEGGQEAIKKLISLPEPPTGLVVADDLMAFGIVNALTDLGLKVPDDMSIISFNNIMLAEYANPSLTSVDIGIFQLGYTAADCLFKILNKEELESTRITVPHTIIKRQSTGERHGVAKL
jgi:DNA-binding LacI/PurR family transcriptional regulator